MRRKGPILWSAVTTVLAAVVLAVACAPYVSRAVFRQVNAVPGVRAERALATAWGVRLEGVSFSDSTTGTAGRFDSVCLGWLTVLGLGRAVEVAGGSVNLPGPRALLSPSSGALADLRVVFTRVRATVTFRRRHLVVTEASGAATLKAGEVSELDINVRQRGGLAQGFALFYDREQANSLRLRLNLAGVRPFLGEDVRKTEGILTFEGSLDDPAAMEGRGRFSAKGVEFEIPHRRLVGGKMEGEAKFKEGDAEINIRAYAGVLKARDIYHDFGLKPASLVVQAEEREGTLTVKHFRLNAPGWVIMDLTGTVDRAARVDLTARLDDVPLRPIMQTEHIKVTTTGNASRTYRITGTWPDISYHAVTEVTGLSFSVPRIQLDIIDIEAGPLEGEWGFQQPEEGDAP